jgi:hypothetical protein
MRRNAVLAEVAQMCAAGRLHDLAQTGLLPGTAVPPAVLRKSRPLVAVLVESPAHARALQALLPDWTLRMGPHALSNTVSGSDREIVTYVAAEAWGLGADVLVRADTDAGWPLTAVPTPPSTTSPLLLLDVAVPGETAAFRVQRQAAYRQRGWTVAAGNPDASNTAHRT